MLPQPTPRARGSKRCSVDLLSPPKRWREAAATAAAAPLRGGDLAGVCDDVEARAEEDDGGDGAVKVWVRVRPVKAGDDAAALFVMRRMCRTHRWQQPNTTAVTGDTWQAWRSALPPDGPNYVIVPLLMFDMCNEWNRQDIEL